jgi:hypothetical protein
MRRRCEPRADPTASKPVGRRRSLEPLRLARREPTSACSAIPIRVSATPRVHQAIHGELGSDYSRPPNSPVTLAGSGHFCEPSRWPQRAWNMLRIAAGQAIVKQNRTQSRKFTRAIVPNAAAPPTRSRHEAETKAPSRGPHPRDHPVAAQPTFANIAAYRSANCGPALVLNTDQPAARRTYRRRRVRGTSRTDA